MARLNMTSSIQPLTRQNALTPTYTTVGANTGIQFSNTGHEVIAVINGATASTYTLNVGAGIEGQTTPPFTGSLPTSNTAPVFYGPFPRDFNQNDGANSIYFDVSAGTTVTVAILQIPGVY